MPLINLSHLETILSALDVKYGEVTEEQILSWLSKENIVQPTVSTIGELYITNKNEIYIL